MLQTDLRDDLAGRESLRETWRFRFSVGEILLAARRKHDRLVNQFNIDDVRTTRRLAAWIYILERRTQERPDAEYALTVDDVMFFGLAVSDAE